MNQNLIANVLSLTLFTVSFFITLRAFYLYLLSHRQRLFILELSMAIIALTAIASFIGVNTLAALSLLVAPCLTRRFGLLKTMIMMRRVCTTKGSEFSIETEYK
jgi:hypothetical protein